MRNKILILFASIFLFTSCDKIDFGDTNDNLNGAKDPDLSALLAGATMRFASLGGREYLTKPVLYSQYMSQVTYTDEMLYNEAPSTWYSYYIQTASNLQTIINTASDETNWFGAIEASGFHNNQVAVATILKAVIFKQVTDAFGDIPYSEAFNLEISTPVYDTQESIYKALISEVKAARDMMDASKLGATGDPIYRGDVASWQKFANSFLMSLSMQLSKKYPAAGGYAATEFASALANSHGVMETIGDEAWYTFDPAHSYNNPWNSTRQADYFLSKEFTDELKGNSTNLLSSNTMLDSRIEIFADDPSRDGVPYGHGDGSGAGTSSMSSLIWAEGAPYSLLTASYTFLNRAEAAARGWTNEDAEALLESAIEVSYASLSDKYEVDITADAAAYAAARVADAGTATGGVLQVIGEEKWVALFPRGFEAWSEWRRTDVPSLTPAVDFQNNGVIARRLIYPSEEAGLNPTGYAQGISTLSPSTDNNSSKVWWDQ